MKVLFLSSMYQRPGGTYSGGAVHRQAVELQNRGVEVRVLCPIPRFVRPGTGTAAGSVGRDATREVDGITVTYLRYPNLPLGVAPGAHASLLHRYLEGPLRRLRRSFPFELIHAHRLFPTGYVALRLAREFDLPGVISAVGSDVHTHPKRNRGIGRRTEDAINAADAVLAVSQDLADQIHDLARPTRPVQVVHMGVDTDRFSPAPASPEIRAALGLPTEGVGICSVCRLVTEKGLNELLEAFERISNDHPRTWLAIVGDGPLRDELKSRMRTRNPGGRVFLVGARPHSEVPAFVNAADIFVLSSYNEGLPNVVLEAMACARPVVATDVGGVSEALEDGVSGTLVPARAVGPLTAALDRLIRSPELGRAMGNAGRDRIRSEFSWTRTAEGLHAVYSGLVETHTSGQAQAGA